MRVSFFDILDNSSVTVLNFPLEPGRDSLQEPFFNEDDENETEQERSSSRVSQAVEEWCKCAKCKSTLTEKTCKCCQEAASHYWNDNVRGGSRIFAPSKLENFSTNNSRFPGASDFRKGHHGKFLSFNLCNGLLRALISCDMFI